MLDEQVGFADVEIEFELELSALTTAVIELLESLGLSLSSGDDNDDDIIAKGRALDEARAAKDFATADAIRIELQNLGYLVETFKEGTRIRRG